jgi:hypothetical protein
VDSIPWRELALIVLALAGAYYLLLPLVVLRSQRMRADADIVIFDPAAAPLPPSLAAYFDGAASRLADVGFRRLANLAIPKALTNARAVLQVYVNEQSSDAAIVNAVFGGPTAAPAAIQVQYVEFISRFRGSSLLLLETNSNPVVGVFGATPQRLTFRFPHVQNVGALFGLHQTLLRKHAGGMRKTLRVMEEFGGDAVAYLRQAVLLEEFQKQEATGYLRRDVTGDCWRPTFKGAYLMAWKLLWPIKQIALSRMRRKALQLERELQSQSARS